MGEFSIGQSVRRREDPRLLHGARPLFRRSQARRSAPCRDRALAARPCRHQEHRHARGAADAGRACRADRQGLRADGLGSLPSMAPYKKRDGSPMYLPPRPAIAIDRVMHVGYPVAVVVADTLDLARDAAERVVVDYAPRPAVVSARDAFEHGRAAALRRLPEQRGLFLPGRRQGQDRRGVRRRRARRRAAPRHQPRHRQSDRAARRHRRIRRRHRPLHAALRLPAAVAVPQRHRPTPR